MKKLLLAFVVLVGFSTIAKAQTTFGLKGGVSFANAKYTETGISETYKSIVTPNIGLTVDFKGGEKFDIESGLFFNGYGGKYSDAEFTSQINLNYLSIPLLGKLKLGSGFSIYAGPQFSFLLSADSKEDGETTSIKDQVKSSAFWAIVGLSFDATENFYLYGEYHAGLTNLEKESLNESKWNANAVSIGLGYKF